MFAGRDPIGQLTDAKLGDHVVANLSEVLRNAEQRGVMLGIENHDTTTNIDLLLEILKRVDSPWLGVTWDSANLAPTPDPYKQLQRIAPYAAVAQFKAMIPVNGSDEPADFPRLIEI